MTLTRMHLRYFKRHPWVNRFTCRRRNACFRDMRSTRPLLTSLHLTRIDGRPS